MSLRVNNTPRNQEFHTLGAQTGESMPYAQITSTEYKDGYTVLGKPSWRGLLCSLDFEKNKRRKKDGHQGHDHGKREEGVRKCHSQSVRE